MVMMTGNCLRWISIGMGAWALALLPAFAVEELKDLKSLASLEAKVQAVAEKAMGSTVALISEKTGASGSGVIASEDGLILTAAHVVQGAETMLVIFPDGKQVKGNVLGANYSKDIAMLRIEDAGKWPAMAMGSSEPLEAGDWVVAMGHSAGFDPNRPPPVRFGRVISTGPGTFLTTDCTLIGGDSGGPLFDLEGRIIAINSSIGQSIQNNNHSGIDGFREDWERLLEGQTWGKLSLNPFSNPEMPVLGIDMGMPRGLKGVLVRQVVQGSPAAAAGVRQGDIIHSINSSRLNHGAELLQILAKHRAGDVVTLGVRRESEELELKVTLKSLQELFETR